MSIERFVAFGLGPILAAGSAWLAGAVGKYGLNLNPTEVDVLATAGAVSGAGFVVKWLHGRQNPEILKLEQEAKTIAGKLSPSLRAELEAFVRGEVVKGQDEIVKVITEHKAAVPPAQAAAPAKGPVA